MKKSESCFTKKTHRPEEWKEIMYNILFTEMLCFIKHTSSTSPHLFSLIFFSISISLIYPFIHPLTLILISEII